MKKKAKRKTPVEKRDHTREKQSRKEKRIEETKKVIEGIRKSLIEGSEVISPRRKYEIIVICKGRQWYCEKMGKRISSIRDYYTGGIPAKEWPRVDQIWQEVVLEYGPLLWNNKPKKVKKARKRSL